MDTNRNLITTETKCDCPAHISTRIWQSCSRAHVGPVMCGTSTCCSPEDGAKYQKEMTELNGPQVNFSVLTSCQATCRFWSWEFTKTRLRLKTRTSPPAFSHREHAFICKRRCLVRLLVSRSLLKNLTRNNQKVVCQLSELAVINTRTRMTSFMFVQYEATTGNFHVVGKSLERSRACFLRPGHIAFLHVGLLLFANESPSAERETEKRPTSEFIHSKFPKPLM